MSRWLILVSLFLAMPISSQTPFPLRQYGSGGAGLGNFVPTFHSSGEFPVVGNSSFRLVSRNLRGGTGGVVWISRNQANLPLPPLSVSIWVDFTNGFSLYSSANGKSGVAGAGAVVVGLPVPNSQALVGASLFMQGFFLDTLKPVSIAHTQGLEFHFTSSISPYVAALYDQKTYQQVVNSSSSGRALWNANAVPGFTYVKTQRYSCNGQTFWIVEVRDNRYGIEFNLIPGGSFRMGCLNPPSGGTPLEETPVHWVHVAPFLLGQYEITQKQWTAVMGNKPWINQRHVGPRTDCPATYISWKDVTSGAGSYCGKTGFRLPSEAEWEYACRAGTTTKYSCGNCSQVLEKYAWFSSTTFPLNENYPHSVGQKLPNPFGLYDIHGNVYEYTEDNFHSNYNGAPTNGSPWLNSTVNQRVVKGGFWGGTHLGCRCARRAGPPENSGDHALGFRPVKSIR